MTVEAVGIGATIVVAALLVILLVLFVTALPDLARYRRVRRM